MKRWEAGTVVVEVSGYESCTDRCSYGTSRSHLTRQRTGERSTKLRACIGSCLAI